MNARLHVIAGRKDPLRELLGLVAGGDEEALRQLYDMTRRRLFGLLYRLLPDRSEAEDVLAEVYVQTWRHAAGFDAGRGSGWLWLVTIARRRAIDRIRAARLRTTSALEDISGGEPSAPDPAPPEQVLGSENAELVRAAVQALPLQQREVLEAAFLGGQSHKEVARSLGLPLGTIKSRIRTGLATLRRSMAAGAEEGTP